MRNKPSQVRNLASWAFRQIRGIYATPASSPVFILGNQKTGTTAIAALISECTGLKATLDFRDIKASRLVGLYEGSIPLRKFLTRHKLEISNKIIKEPNLSLVFSQIRILYPDSKIVMIVRDPRDNIRSMLDRLNLPGDREDLTDEQLQDIHPVWKTILYSTGLKIPGERYIERLAQRWKYIADEYINNSKDIVLVRYEDFVKEKINTIKKVVIHIGLEPIYEVESIINKQFQPSGNKNISWIDYFGQDNLKEIEEICGKEMSLIGYNSILSKE